MYLEAEVMRGSGSIPTGGNIFHWIFFLFSCSKVSDANIGIIANELRKKLDWCFFFHVFIFPL